MSSEEASQHLIRAYRLIEGVAGKTAELQQHASSFLASQSPTESLGSLVSGMVSDFRTKKALGSEKASLTGDLNLAWSQIEAAERLEPDAAITVDEAPLTVSDLKAGILGQRGIVEMAWGSSSAARQHFARSLELVEDPITHFWMGCLDESAHKPSEALKHFERCLELDPDGELSVDALRAAEQMRKYRKKFRGSWPVVGCLALLVLGGLVAVLRVQTIFSSEGFGQLVLAAILVGALVLYWRAKWK